MEDLRFECVFHEIGFAGGVDVSERELESLHSQFVTMYNQFASMSNSILDKVRDIWDSYEFAKTFSKELSEQMAKTMGISPDATYEDWETKWYMQIADAVDVGFPFGKLKSWIFHDDGIPHYGVCFKKNPNWKMYVTIKQIET